ncbi:Uu.00g144080.m01.CDS01 [Anthostomella pinea]|uniref:Uu.00g144080.m01.CDS01 n=1 Tax=Anthostomella pinea TaxID=933095 RepID=A0AAI8VQT3_9PEZI|nr:Uu.00g144080.m01.CDS01 [Anthostomella pinea]
MHTSGVILDMAALASVVSAHMGAFPPAMPIAATATAACSSSKTSLWRDCPTATGKLATDWSRITSEPIPTGTIPLCKIRDALSSSLDEEFAKYTTEWISFVGMSSSDLLDFFTDCYDAALPTARSVIDEIISATDLCDELGIAAMATPTVALAQQLLAHPKHASVQATSTDTVSCSILGSAINNDIPVMTGELSSAFDQYSSTASPPDPTSSPDPTDPEDLDYLCSFASQLPLSLRSNFADYTSEIISSISKDESSYVKFYTDCVFDPSFESAIRSEFDRLITTSAFCDSTITSATVTIVTIPTTSTSTVTSSTVTTSTFTSGTVTTVTMITSTMTTDTATATDTTTASTTITSTSTIPTTTASTTTTSTFTSGTVTTATLTASTMTTAIETIPTTTTATETTTITSASVTTIISATVSTMTIPTTTTSTSTIPTTTVSATTTTTSTTTSSVIAGAATAPVGLVGAAVAAGLVGAAAIL